MISAVGSKIDDADQTGREESHRRGQWQAPMVAPLMAMSDARGIRSTGLGSKREKHQEVEEGTKIMAR